MSNSKNHTVSTSTSTLAARPVDFEGQPVTAVMFRGRWCWRGAEVGAAIGYEHGRKLVDKIRGDWSEDFREGADFDVLRGHDLAALTAGVDSTDSVESSIPRRGARSLVVLYESGIDRALLLSRTEKGRRLRTLLVDHVLPQLRATGTATLPGAAPPALDPEALRAIVAAAVADQLRALAPQNVTGALPILGRRDRGAVLDPILRMARSVAGPGAPRREVSRERGRIDHRLRLALRWDARWCFYPAVREGELVLAIREEERLVERITDRVSRNRQLSLRAVGGSASR